MKRNSGKCGDYNKGSAELQSDADMSAHLKKWVISGLNSKKFAEEIFELWIAARTNRPTLPYLKTGISCNMEMVGKLAVCG